jgi:hypothetical protein
MLKLSRMLEFECRGLIYPMQGEIMECQPSAWWKDHGKLYLVSLCSESDLVFRLVVCLLDTLLALCISSLVGLQNLNAISLDIPLFSWCGVVLVNWGNCLLGAQFGTLKP